jgi:phosphate transport system substrate-binding protein
LRLSGAVIADIFLGKITRWDDKQLKELNPGVALPAREITVVHRSDGSGTTSVFTHYLSQVSPDWSSRVGAGKSVDWPVGLGGKGNDGVAAAIKQAPAGLGYIDLAYARSNHLPCAAVQNRAGRFVAPTVAGTVAAAAAALPATRRDIRNPISDASGVNSYPVAGYTYLLVFRRSRNPRKAKQLVGFLQWAMSEGQKEGAELSYAPLPPSVVALNEQTISTLR